MKIRTVLLLALLLCPFSTLAQTCTTAVCNAASPSETDVQNALPASSNTNATVVVNIPSGTGTWTGGFTYTVPSAVTNLTIQGNTTVSCSGTAGTSSYTCSATDNSIIVDSYASNTSLITFNIGGSSTYFRITGLTFKGGSTSLGKDNGFLQIFTGNSQNVRYDHNHTVFSAYTPTTTEAVALRTFAPIAGVADHNYLDLGPDTQYSFGISNFGAYNDAYGNGDGTYANPTPWGQYTGVFYVESNYVTGGEINDCGNAGAMVIRYNTFNDATAGIQTHGTKSPAGPGRGCRSLEAYHNYFTHPTGSPADSAIGSKIGPAMVWGNIVAAGYSRFFAAATDRSGGDSAAETNTPGGWGYCNTVTPTTGGWGSGQPANGTGSAWDANQPSITYGYPCLDNIGRGQTVQHLNGANFPGRLNAVTGTIAWPEQYLEPVYLFDNTLTLSTGNAQALRDLTTLPNRDVYSDSNSLGTTYGAWNGSSYGGTVYAGSSFNGTTGTGSGLLASRPLTCTAGAGGTYGASPTGSYGVAYWATDANSGMGELYVCTATNVWTPIYEPSVYPHPLAGGGTTFSFGITAPNATYSGSNCTPGNPLSGTVISCSFTANSGYSITSLSGTGSAIACTSSPCSFTITANTTITVVTTPNTYTITTASAGTGAGTIAGCAGSHAYLSPYSCALSPAGGSTIASASGCGGSLSGSTYSGTMPASNCTITVTWQGTATLPTFSPVAGSYSSAQHVVISSNAPIFYTVNGSTPTTSSTRYLASLNIAATQTIEAIAGGAGWTNSSVASASYTIAKHKTRHNLTTTSSSVSPTPFPTDNRACCGSNVAALEPSRGSFVWTTLDAWRSQSATNGSTLDWTLQGFPTWMTGLSNVESAPPTDLNTVATCQNVLAGVRTTDCSMKELATAMAQHVSGLTSAPSSPVNCQNLDTVEPINEFNADSLLGSSTGWTGTYVQLAQLAGDVAAVYRTYCSNTVMLIGSVSSIVGSHTNGESGYFDVAEGTLMADLAADGTAGLFGGASFHIYTSRGTVAPGPMPTTNASHSSAACTPLNVPNVNCYIAVKDQAALLTTNALQLSGNAPWAANLPIYSTEGGFGTLSQLCGTTCSNTATDTIALRSAFVSEYMMFCAASGIEYCDLYAAFDTTWGDYQGSPVTGWYQAFLTTYSWVLTTCPITPGTFTSTPVTGGNLWTKTETCGQYAFFDGWYPATTTQSTSYNTMQNLAGVTSSTGGAFTVGQKPVLLFSSAISAPSKLTGTQVLTGTGKATNQ